MPLSVPEWVDQGLEQLGRCPCCDSTGRELLYSGLQDLAFAAVPGNWTMWSCRNCQSAYLDPRLSPGAIPRAYRNYYTHNTNKGDLSLHDSTLMVQWGLKQRLAVALFWASQA